MSKGDFVVKYTNKDIMDKLECIDKKLSSHRVSIRWLRVIALGAYGYTTLVLGFLWRSVF